MTGKSFKLFECLVIAGVATIAASAVYAQAANKSRFKLVAVKTLEADSAKTATAPVTSPTPLAQPSPVKQLTRPRVVDPLPPRNRADVTQPTTAKTISEKGVSSSKPR